MSRFLEARLLELFADSVTEGLCPAGAAELLQALPHGCSECLEFGRAATAMDLALASLVAEPPPLAVRDRILIGVGCYMESVDRRVAAGREGFK